MDREFIIFLFLHNNYWKKDYIKLEEVVKVYGIKINTEKQTFWDRYRYEIMIARSLKWNKEKK